MGLLPHDLWGTPGMTMLDWQELEPSNAHKHKFRLSRVDTRTYGVRDSCWGFYYQVYVFECSHIFCPVIWDVGVEDFWDRKIYDTELPD